MRRALNDWMSCECVCSVLTFKMRLKEGNKDESLAKNILGIEKPARKSISFGPMYLARYHRFSYWFSQTGKSSFFYEFQKKTHQIIIRTFFMITEPLSCFIKYWVVVVWKEMAGKSNFYYLPWGGQTPFLLWSKHTMRIAFLQLWL